MKSTTQFHCYLVTRRKTFHLEIRGTGFKSKIKAWKMVFFIVEIDFTLISDKVWRTLTYLHSFIAV